MLIGWLLAAKMGKSACGIFTKAKQLVTVQMRFRRSKLMEAGPADRGGPRAPVFQFHACDLRAPPSTRRFEQLLEFKNQNRNPPLVLRLVVVFPLHNTLRDFWRSVEIVIEIRGTVCVRLAAVALC
jgi:hypothetical protein